MKKILIIFLLLIVLCGCSNNGNSEKDIPNIPNKTDASDDLNTTDDPNTGNITKDSNILVVYFSVTNNTKKLALYAQEHLQSDIFEIIPKQEYTQADINYNSDCRANREQNDESAKPEIKNTISDISKYDTIVLGYPIWWGQAPKILYTFIESYDFSGKTIVPFCTSGSSPIGSSATNLARSAIKANWTEGKRFSASASKEEISNWLDQKIEVKKEMKKEIKLFIDEQEVEVSWEDNESVKALYNLMPLTINMSEYGGFEQTGAIGTSITRNDIQMNVVPGDIVLYNGNAISVFYSESEWRYTKLGHINNMSKTELNSLLNKASVTLSLKEE